MDYQALTPELVQELSAIAPGRVFTGSDINEDYSHDEMPIYGKSVPEAVVEAASTEEIAAVMKFCNEHHIPVTPRGAGTGLVGGAVPIRGGVLLVTTRMNKILGYDEENFTVTVQPGVLLNTLAEDAASKGLLYPPDPGEKFATLGGNVSTNAGGMRAVKYGCTRDYVKAMTVVLPTGEIIHLGSSVSKTSSGYSLLNLMIGSEGTLGIITELTLKLIPAPKETISLIIPYPDMESCIATVPAFFMHHLNPQALEFMGKDIVISSEAYAVSYTHLTSVHNLTYRVPPFFVDVLTARRGWPDLPAACSRCLRVLRGKANRAFPRDRIFQGDAEAFALPSASAADYLALPRAISAAPRAPAYRPMGSVRTGRFSFCESCFTR